MMISVHKKYIHNLIVVPKTLVIHISETTHPLPLKVQDDKSRAEPHMDMSLYDDDAQQFEKLSLQSYKKFFAAVLFSWQVKQCPMTLHLFLSFLLPSLFLSFSNTFFTYCLPFPPLTMRISRSIHMSDLYNLSDSVQINWKIVFQIIAMMLFFL